MAWENEEEPGKVARVGDLLIYKCIFYLPKGYS